MKTVVFSINNGENKMKTFMISIRNTSFKTDIRKTNFD